MRYFRDRDFIETPEKFIFCVVGSTHPKTHIMAYLKYVPSNKGLWGRKNTKFQRVMKEYTMENLIETLRILERHPQYIYHFDAFGIRMSAVPINNVIKHFKPEQRLKEILMSPELDSLELKVSELASLIIENSIPKESIGVTGSILLKIHNISISDIDLVVYGLDASERVKNIILNLYSEGILKRFSGIMLENWCKSKVRKYPITFEDAKQIYERKWNIGIFKDVRFSIHPVRVEHEAEPYGSRFYRPLGVTCMKAIVTDAHESIFLPAIYKIDRVKIISGTKARDIREVCSYESIYAGIAREGETIIVKGKLEQVKDLKTGEEYYRVLVGSLEGKGYEYVKLA